MYYVMSNDCCIGIFVYIDDVNRFLARKGYSVVNIKHSYDNGVLVEVEKW